jgi:hypothetical protein
MLFQLTLLTMFYVFSLQILIFESSAAAVNDGLGTIDVSIDIRFGANSDAGEVARRSCSGTVPSCYRIARPAIELAMHDMYQTPLSDWKYSDSCKSWMPHQEELSFVQHMHIPKTGGTAFNYFLHDYCGCPIPEDTTPCTVSIVSVSNHDSILYVRVARCKSLCVCSCF